MPDQRLGESTTTPLRFALLGSWHDHASIHVREAARRPDEFRLLGMYDSDEQVVAAKRPGWVEMHDDLAVFPSVDAVLQSEAEAVVVEGRIYENLDYAEQALDAGKHVLLEKPAGVDIDHLARVHDLARSRGLMLQMAYVWRYNPAVREIVRLTRAGALGDIFYFRGHMPKPKEWYPEMERDVGIYKGASYFEMAGHYVDLMLTLMGEPTAVHPVLGRHYGDSARFVDNAVVVHEFERGLATIDTASMHVGMDRTRRVEVYGTLGTAVHTQLGSNNLSLCLELAAEGYEEGWQDVVIERPPTLPTGQGGALLLHELSACIRGKKSPDYTLEHDMAVQKVLYAGCEISDGASNEMTAAGADPPPPRRDPVAPLRVAVIGCGPRGLQHMDTLRQFEDVSLAAVCDVSEEMLNRAADDFNVAGRYTRLEDLLDTETLDAVWVAVSAHLNAELARPCLEMGLSTFVEKPPGLSVAETAGLRDTAARTGAKAMVGWNRRFNSIIVKAREMVEARGPVIQLVGEFHKGMTEATERIQERHRDNILLESAIHSIDLIRAIAGSEVAEVHSVVRRAASRYKDVHAALVVFESGCVAQLTFNYTTDARLERYEIHGREISAYLEGVNGGFIVQDGDKIALGGPSDSRPVQARYFLDCVSNDRLVSLPAADLDEAVKTMQLAEAILAGLRA